METRQLPTQMGFSRTAGLRDERDLSIAVRLGCGAVAGTLGQVGAACRGLRKELTGIPCLLLHSMIPRPCALALTAAADLSFSRK